LAFQQEVASATASSSPPKMYERPSTFRNISGSINPLEKTKP
jgi:hypothetical protein